MRSVFSEMHLSAWEQQQAAAQAQAEAAAEATATEGEPGEEQPVEG